MRKVIFILTILLILSGILGTNFVYADNGVNSIIAAMDGTSNATSPGNDGIGATINNIIGVLQVVGSGLSIIVITMLGIKYILASPGEKADVKKSIIPIGIGCVLLFGAVNLTAAIADLSNIMNN